MVHAILTFSKLLKEAKTSSAATWQIENIKQSNDWCIYIETELASLEEQQRQDHFQFAQQKADSPLPSLDQLLQASHCFFQSLLQNPYISNSLYLYVVRNYRFLTPTDKEILVKDLVELAQVSVSKNILRDILKEWEQ
ncbi:hypothetical protein BY458DRAFT_557464 [Sporodiniella umbellata]|nr:hypothetical protein BY458DRAFT_557464 [Sporodiniella umbellata]